ncbi:hypothetical protein B0J12DRAFT_775142 [Macrophomina phaseolina]|uniref:Secreted protein n=1 Tax=Macrophomina phaseolina TaxID=35725 RepID=A0ABQ8GJ85_9PEZI|nr:hypothetical protein B0J12DRAFT_775142 [Macrophomina phaseolina]
MPIRQASVFFFFFFPLAIFQCTFTSKERQKQAHHATTRKKRTAVTFSMRLTRLDRFAKSPASRISIYRDGPSALARDHQASPCLGPALPQDYSSNTARRSPTSCLCPIFESLSKPYAQARTPELLPQTRDFAMIENTSLSLSALALSLDRMGPVGPNAQYGRVYLRRHARLILNRARSSKPRRR